MSLEFFERRFFWKDEMEFTPPKLIDEVRAIMRRAVERANALNINDTRKVIDHQTDDLELANILMKMRKREMLRPVDLAELRVAFSAHRGSSEFRKLVASAIAETVLEREVKKDTPR